MYALEVMLSQDVFVANEHLRQTRLQSGIVPYYGNQGEIATITVLRSYNLLLAMFLFPEDYSSLVAETSGQHRLI